MKLCACMCKNASVCVYVNLPTYKNEVTPRHSHHSIRRTDGTLGERLEALLSMQGHLCCFSTHEKRKYTNISTFTSTSSHNHNMLVVAAAASRQGRQGKGKGVHGHKVRRGEAERLAGHGSNEPTRRSLLLLANAELLLLCCCCCRPRCARKRISRNKTAFGLLRLAKSTACLSLLVNKPSNLLARDLGQGRGDLGPGRAISDKAERERDQDKKPTSSAVYLWLGKAPHDSCTQ